MLCFFSFLVHLVSFPSLSPVSTSSCLSPSLSSFSSHSLTQPDTLEKLVKYVTEMPTATDTEARRYKYPFVSSEVLSCDVSAVREKRVPSAGGTIRRDERARSTI